MPLSFICIWNICSFSYFRPESKISLVQDSEMDRIVKTFVQNRQVKFKDA